MTPLSTAIGDLVRRNAERRSEHAAYIYASGDRTDWAGFNERVNRLANGLLARGCKKGDVVASLSMDGPVLNEVFFALAKIGAVRVGVNYRYSPPEVASLVKHSGARFAIVEDRFLDLLRLAPPVTTFRCGDGQSPSADYADLIAAGSPGEPRIAVDEQDIAAICYTTGSTGHPKGALWTHRNVVEAIGQTALASGMRPEDVWLHCLPGAGVPGLLAIWNVVLGWCSVVLDQFSPNACLDAIQAHGVTSTVWVPTMLHGVIVEQQREPRSVQTMRKVVYGSAPSTPALIRRALATFPVAELEQWYGSTEGAGGWFTRLDHSAHLAAMAGDEALLTSCGKGMQHVDLAIRGEDGTFLSAGEIGEICVASPSVMVGYHEEPGLTAQRLEDGWLRTGDVGRLDEKGFLYILDRREFMIISGGYNIYPVEVENVVAEHPAVAEVAVVGVPDERWGEVVTAVVTLNPGAELDVEELRASCRSQLASFKVPRHIVVRDDLPRGPTGKLLKRQIKEEAVRQAQV